MTIIVTGGAGFIGSNFIFYQLEHHPEDRIVCLDKLTYAGNLSTLASVMDRPNFRFVKADICDREAVNRLFDEEKPEIIVNFAAESHVDRSIEDPGVFLRTNILGTQVLMDACRKHGIGRYHQVSTDEVYGDLPLDRPDLFFTEETPIHTSSPYSASKASADLLVLAYHRTFGLPVTISRCSNNYGPYHFPEKLIPLMIANCLNDKPLPVYGKGENVRDWLYVEDHCKAIDLIIHNGKVYHGANGMAGEVGHTVIIKDGLPCPCGRRGCWEQYASATALKRMTAEALAAHPDSILAQVVAENDGRVSGQSAFIAARQGDPVGQRICEEYVSYLSCGIVNMVNVFQPDTLAIGGGVSNEADEQLLLPVQRCVERESIPCGKNRRTRIVKAELGNQAGIIGAALLGKNKRI